MKHSKSWTNHWEDFQTRFLEALWAANTLEGQYFVLLMILVLFSTDTSETTNLSTS